MWVLYPDHTCININSYIKNIITQGRDTKPEKS